MHEKGLVRAGYEWFVLDDCWQPTRDSNGTLVPRLPEFPNGMTPVIDHVHALGMKFGLYTSVGTTTCRETPGSWGHFQQDADLFASWKVDYVKVDYCGALCSEEGHKEISKALNRTGRPMVLELCRGPYQEQEAWGYAPSIAQVWRSSGDHHDNRNNTLMEIDSMTGRSQFTHPFGWAYGDMLMTGGQRCPNYTLDEPAHCPAMTDNEYRTEFSVYAIMQSPLLVGTDVRLMTPIMTELMYNEEVREINQDIEHPPGDIVPNGSCAGHENNAQYIYSKRLSYDRLAIAITNRDATRKTVTMCLQSVGWTLSNEARVRDVYRNHEEFTRDGALTLEIETHDTKMFILSRA